MTLDIFLLLAGLICGLFAGRLVSLLFWLGLFIALQALVSFGVFISIPIEHRVDSSYALGVWFSFVAMLLVAGFTPFLLRRGLRFLWRKFRPKTSP